LPLGWDYIFGALENLSVENLRHKRMVQTFKFAISLGVYSWTMAWYCHYLPNFNLSLFNWTVVVLWSFELIYIALQASKGQLSHYNLSTPVYTILYGLMAIAATVVTLYSIYRFFIFQR
jgi:cation transport ATPase